MLHQLVSVLHLPVQGSIGESYNKLFCNFASPEAADAANTKLNSFSASAAGMSASIKHAGPPRHGNATAAGGKPVQPLSSNQLPNSFTVVVEAGSLIASDVAQQIEDWKQTDDFCNAIQIVARLPLVYFNFATHAAASDAVRSYNSSTLTRHLYKHITSRAILKSSLNKQQVSQAPYCAKQLRPVDETYFKSAGLLCAKRSASGLVEVLLGREAGRLTLLGGKHEFGEGSQLTASREFNEETAYQLEPEAAGALLVSLMPYASVIWVCGASTNSMYALYVLDIATLPDSTPQSQSLRSAATKQFDTIGPRFAKFRTGAAWKSLPVAQQEMQALEWFKVHPRHVIAAKQSQLSPFLAKVVSECAPLQEWVTAAIHHGSGPVAQTPLPKSGGSCLAGIQSWVQTHIASPHGQTPAVESVTPTLAKVPTSGPASSLPTAVQPRMTSGGQPSSSVTNTTALVRPAGALAKSKAPTATPQPQVEHVESASGPLAAPHAAPVAPGHFMPTAFNAGRTTSLNAPQAATFAQPFSGKPGPVNRAPFSGKQAQPQDTTPSQFFTDSAANLAYEAANPHTPPLTSQAPAHIHRASPVATEEDVEENAANVGAHLAAGKTSYAWQAEGDPAKLPKAIHPVPQGEEQLTGGLPSNHEPYAHESAASSESFTDTILSAPTSDRAKLPESLHHQQPLVLNSCAEPDYYKDKSRDAQHVLMVMDPAAVEAAASKLCEAKGCQLGEEVGLVKPGNVVVSAHSRTIYVTPAFFQKPKYDIDAFGAIVVSLPGSTETEPLLDHLRGICNAVPGIKLVIM